MRRFIISANIQSKQQVIQFKLLKRRKKLSCTQTPKSFDFTQEVYSYTPGQLLRSSENILENFCWENEWVHMGFYDRWDSTTKKKTGAWNMHAHFKGKSTLGKLLDRRGGAHNYELSWALTYRPELNWNLRYPHSSKTTLENPRNGVECIWDFPST